MSQELSDSQCMHAHNMGPLYLYSFFSFVRWAHIVHACVSSFHSGPYTSFDTQPKDVAKNGFSFPLPATIMYLGLWPEEKKKRNLRCPALGP